MLMSVPPTHTTVIQMRLVQTLRAVSRVPAILDSLETEHIVRMSMNVSTAPVITMQHATIWSDITYVLATLGTLEMEHTVKTSMNAM